MATVMGLSSAETIEIFNQYVIPNYKRYPVSLVRGEGSYVWDAEGNRYLDFFPGWGCNLLGHCPQPVVEAVQEVFNRREQLRGFRIIEAPRVLRHFTAKFEEV